MTCSTLRAVPARLVAITLACGRFSARVNRGFRPGRSEPERQGQAATATGRPKADRKRTRRAATILADVSKQITGPAGNPECVWLGRRVVHLLWRDDLDTAFRHLDLYDRFGCPGGHIQATFRCVVKQGPIDPKATDSLQARVHSCWINPAAAPARPRQPLPRQRRNHQRSNDVVSDPLCGVINSPCRNAIEKTALLRYLTRRSRRWSQGTGRRSSPSPVWFRVPCASLRSSSRLWPACTRDCGHF